MISRRLTLALILGIIVASVALELGLVLTGNPTISDVIRDWYRIYPPLGFLTGLVSGGLLAHWFWQ